MSIPPLRRLVLLASAPLALWLLSACGAAEKDVPARDTTRAVAPAPVSAPSPDAAEQARVDSVLAMLAACPRDGRWHICSVERRLSQSGFRPVLEPDSSAGIPGLPGAATHWRLGRQSLRVIFFPDSAAAQSAFSGLDSANAAPRGDSTVVWPDRATLLRSANTIAVLLGGTDRTVERLADALLAGPPQP